MKHFNQQKHKADLPRKKFTRVRYFVRVNFSHIQLILKIFIAFLTNVLFKYPMKTSVYLLISRFQKNYFS